MKKTKKVLSNVENCVSNQRKKAKIGVDGEKDDVSISNNNDLSAMAVSPPSEKNCYNDQHQEQPQQQHQISFLDDPNQLADSIFDEDVQLAVWRRPKLPNFIKTLSNMPYLDPSHLPNFYGKVTPNTVADMMRNKLLIQKTPTLRATSPTTTTTTVTNNTATSSSSSQTKKDEEHIQSSISTGRLSNTDIEELIQDVERLVKVFHNIIADGGSRDDEASEPEDDDQDKDNSGEGEGEGEDGVSEVYVKFEWLTDNGCVFWHQDTVPLRMVTTYKGLCTEYIEDGGDPQISQYVLSNRQHDHSKYTKSLSNRDVALFKGRYFDNDDDDDDGNEDEDENDDDDDINDVEEEKEGSNLGDEDEEEEEEDPDDVILGSGIVHRSPRIEGTGLTRLVLVLDIPADFHEDDNGDEDENSNDDSNDDDDESS